jgi:hypothetical protein
MRAKKKQKVLVEVVSLSTEAHDRGKWAHYRRIDSLREYILLAQDEPRIELHRRNERNAFAALRLEKLPSTGWSNRSGSSSMWTRFTRTRCRVEHACIPSPIRRTCETVAQPSACPAAAECTPAQFTPPYGSVLTVSRWGRQEYCCCRGGQKGEGGGFPVDADPRAVGHFDRREGQRPVEERIQNLAGFGGVFSSR